MGATVFAASTRIVAGRVSDPAGICTTSDPSGDASRPPPGPITAADGVPAGATVVVLEVALAELLDAPDGAADVDDPGGDVPDVLLLGPVLDAVVVDDALVVECVVVLGCVVVCVV